MRRGAEGRTRLLLIILIVTALFLITLDLRGVSVLEGARQASQTILSPFQRAGTVVLSPIKNLISDITQLGRTRSQIEKLQADMLKRCNISQLDIRKPLFHWLLRHAFLFVY